MASPLVLNCAAHYNYEQFIHHFGQLNYWSFDKTVGYPLTFPVYARANVPVEWRAKYVVALNNASFIYWSSIALFGCLAMRSW